MKRRRHVVAKRAVWAHLIIVSTPSYQPCPSIQARSQGAQFPAHPAWPPHPRHRPPDQRQARAPGPFRLSPRSRDQGRPPGPSPAPAKVYALHAPEVECIGKGKARAPYEFGCKVSIATPVTSPRGGQFVPHAKALHGNCFGGHTLAPVIKDMEALTGIDTRRIHIDKGYRRRYHPHKFRVWISGQVSHVTGAMRREMKLRTAVERVIGHIKAEHRIDRNYLEAATAIASTLSSRPPATTSACCSDALNALFGALSETTQTLRTPKSRVLHG